MTPVALAGALAVDYYCRKQICKHALGSISQISSESLALHSFRLNLSLPLSVESVVLQWLHFVSAVARSPN